MYLYKRLEDAISKYRDNDAFFINDTRYTYRQLEVAIAGLRQEIRAHCKGPSRQIGLVTNDDLETYAAILASWFEGNSYVPLSPQMPAERNEDIIRIAEIEWIIDSSPSPLFPEHNLIQYVHSPAKPIAAPLVLVEEDELAYTVFTSGTTGIPKGVPITINNLSTFVDAFLEMGLKLDDRDRWLQMFELTFDLSVMSYLVPLLHGACVFTIPKNEIKFGYIFRLMDEQKLTVALMIPSVIQYLRPYFDEIDCPEMKYNLFCGEALPMDVTSSWSRCIPNAAILNVYGPSEATIFCTQYTFNRSAANKSHNGVLSIGKAMSGTFTMIAGDDNNALAVGEAGELCLAGGQLTPGYLHDVVKTGTVFFDAVVNEKSIRYYRTGDLCFIDGDGDIMYMGRTDSQVKIQGYRVELPEIEFQARECLVTANTVAVAFKNDLGTYEIGLFIESKPFETETLIAFLKTKLPFYMIPGSIRFEDHFPLNNNGKTDRKELLKKFQQA